MRDFEKKKKLLTIIALVNFVLVLLFSFLILFLDKKSNEGFINVSRSEMLLSFYDNASTPLSSTYPYNEILEIQDRNFILIPVSGVSVLGYNAQVEFDENYGLFLDSGEVFIATDSNLNIFIHDKRIEVLAGTEIFVDIENERIYVISGNVLTFDRVLGKELEVLTWEIDSFNTSLFEFEEFKENLNLLRIFYFMYDLNEVPENLSSYTPENQLYQGEE